MTIAKNIIIVSDKKDDILNFCSKLNILRDIDSFIGCRINEAMEYCVKNIPDTIIFFIYGNDARIVDICRHIRQDFVLRNIPILCIFDKWDEEYALACFDAGMKDFIIQPASDSEFLMRTMSMLQKSVMAREIDKKTALLSDLGVNDAVTGAYKPEYIPKVFTAEINAAKKYKYPLTLLAVSVDKPAKYSEDSYLSKIICRAVRNSDSFGIPEKNKFFIILPQTGINGADVVIERIKSKLDKGITISAGVCESFDGMDYELLSKYTLEALIKAVSGGENKVEIGHKEEKPVEETNTPSENLLDKVKANKQEYKKFRQEFTKKIEKVIMPVFNMVKNDLTEKYPGIIEVEQNISETKCLFIIKDIKRKSEVQLKIIDPGFARVVIDNVIIKSNDQIKKHFTVNVNDLTENNILKVLQNLFSEFKSINE